MIPSQPGTIDTQVAPMMSSASPTSEPNTSTNSAKPKRKRRSADSTDQPRKKKANRACFHCQKAHLTCDDSRPCQRCIKRGLQDSCTDGVRKKAKYLLDDDELEELKRSQEAKKDDLIQKSLSAPIPGSQPYGSGHIQPTQPLQPSPSTSSTLPVAGPSSYPSIVFPNSQDLSFLTGSPSLISQSDPSLNSFGSEALNMEYSILSQILGSTADTINPNSWLESTNSLTGTPYLSYPGSFTPSHSTPQQPQQPSPYIGESSSQGEQHPLAPRYPLNMRPRSPHDLPSSVVWPSASPPEEIVPVSQNPPELLQLHPLAPRWPLNARPRTPPHNPAWPAPLPPSQNGVNTPALQGITSLNPSSLCPPSPVPSFQSTSTISQPPSLGTVRQHSSDITSACGGGGGGIGLSGAGMNAGPSSELRQIMQKVTEPYDYTEGYHFLMRFLKEKFEKNDILRIVRALAIFRPSLIALQMPLSLDDEIFVEQCFQRSLLELEKLMSFTGTPTVVWRRTGEICLVANEFLLLTGWTKQDLLPSSEDVPPKRKYIYELFDSVSTVEYWENFAQHAFENSTHTVYSHCALLKPNGMPVPCSFCFTVRRDMFDLPSLIVGQWLPLL